MALVLDASVTMAWVFEDEATPYAKAVFAQLGSDEATVPAIWPLEVTNVLLIAERRRRIAQADAARFLQSLEALPITVEAPIPIAAIDPVLTLAREQVLSVYDASYLELAMREGPALATQDTRLRAAAVRVGVELVEAEPKGGEA